MSNVSKAWASKKSVLCASLKADNSNHQKSSRNNKAVLKEEVKAVPIVKQRNRDIERRSKVEVCREIIKNLPLDYTALLSDTLTVDDNISSSYIAAAKNESCNSISADITDSVPVDSSSGNTIYPEPFIASGEEKSGAISSFDSRIVNAPSMSTDMSNKKNVSELSGGLYGCGLSEITAVSASNNEQCGKEPSVSGNNEIWQYNQRSNELFSSDIYMSYNNNNEENMYSLSESSKNWSQPIPEASANMSSDSTNKFWLSSKCVHADLKEQNIPDVLKRTLFPSNDNEFEANRTIIVNSSIEYSEYSDSETSDVEAEFISFEKFGSEMCSGRIDKRSPKHSYMSSYDKSDYVVIDLSK